MKRRVVRHGEATLTISLPAKWVKKVGLTPKTEVEVSEEGTNLVVSAEKREAVLKEEINLKNNEKTGFRNIISYYRKGYDELNVSYSNPGYLKRIEQCLSEELLGYEIVQQGRNCCLIKDVSGTKAEEFDTLFRRVWLIIKAISESCYDCISKEDYSLVESIETMDKRVNKFSNYCIRILIKRGHSDYKNIPLMYRLLRGLEELSDQYKYFAQIFSKRKVKADKEVVKLLEKINQNYDGFYKNFYKYNPEALEEIFVSAKEIFVEIEKLFTKEKDKEQLHYVLILNEKIKILLSSIIEYYAA